MPSVLVERCSPLAVWVYLHLSRQAGAAGVVEATVAQVEAWCGVTFKPISRALRELEAVAVCRVERRSDENGARLPNRYLFGGAPEVPPEPVEPAPAEVAEAEPPPKAPKVEKPDRTVPPFPPTLDTPVFRAALDRYLEVRQAKRYGRWLTSTWKANLAKWEKWGHDRAVAALTNSADNEYQGVFEPKTAGGSAKPKTREEERAELERTFPGWKSDSWYREHGFEPPDRGA